MTEDTQKMLREHCEEIAAELERRKDDMFFYSEEEQEELGQENYFDDIFDIKYILDYKKELFAVRICVAYGSSNIYIDTETGFVNGYWGYDCISVPLAYGVAEAIDNYVNTYLLEHDFFY